MRRARLRLDPSRRSSALRPRATAQQQLVDLAELVSTGPVDLGAFTQAEMAVVRDVPLPALGAPRRAAEAVRFSRARRAATAPWAAELPLACSSPSPRTAWAPWRSVVATPTPPAPTGGGSSPCSATRSSAWIGSTRSACTGCPSSRWAMCPAKSRRGCATVAPRCRAARAADRRRGGGGAPAGRERTEAMAVDPPGPTSGRARSVRGGPGRPHRRRPRRSDHPRPPRARATSASGWTPRPSRSSCAACSP